MSIHPSISAPTFSYASDEVGPTAQRIIRAIETLTGQLRIKRLYDRYQQMGNPPELFWDDAVRALRLSVRLNRSPRVAVPLLGPLVVVANHPFGVVDGVVLSWLVAHVRTDFKILTHRVLHQAPQARDYILPIDFSETKAALANNLKARRDALAVLEAGGVVIVFPSGGVALSKGMLGDAVDLEWKTFAAKLILGSGADVLPVFFRGQNSRLFQVAGNIHQTLKLSLLFHEVANKIGKTISVTIGDLIPNQRLQAMADRAAVTDYLKRTVHGMGGIAAGR